MDFPTWLRIKMAERNINNDGLSRLIGVSHVAIGRWSRGRNLPSYENCLKIAEVFNVSLEEVLTLTGRPIPQTQRIAEPRITYETGSRAHLHSLVDQVSDDQVEFLAHLLEKLAINQSTPEDTTILSPDLRCNTPPMDEEQL